MRDISDPTQTDFQLHFESDGDARGWLVRHMHFHERLSEPYRLVLELDNPDPRADPSDFIGQNCTLFIERPPQQRRILGVIVRVERGLSADPRYAVCALHVAPAFALLQQVVGSRIFQERSVPDILQEVLGPGLGAYGRTLDASALQRSYDPREYTVQYQESDFDFVSRLMEQEGIAYRFGHDGATERLVLSDSNTTFDDLQTIDGGPVQYVPDKSGVITAEPIRTFLLGHELATTSLDLRDFDWTNPDTALSEQVAGIDERGRSRELYVHQRDVTITGYDEPKYQIVDLATQARLRLEELKVASTEARGDGWVMGLSPGTVFELLGHGDLEVDGRYAVVSVDHEGRRHTGDEAGDQAYSNRFRCIPVDVPFRPRRRTPRPRVHGVQTAMVTGPAGEEIHTDVHGRIKVQFHWDRVGKRDDHTTCWIRVSQPWGGAGWGFVFIPRIGMEVIVTFIDGDPDRPLVTGSVYNGSHALPYSLPDEKTKSTIKTQSSLGGDGFNELRFEDRAGEEEIYVHAQKDYNEHVLHDHSTQVDHDQSNTVDHDQTELVKHDQTLTVDHDRTKTVKHDETTTVERNRTETVKKDETITIEGNRTETVKKDETITIEGSRTETVKKDETITIEGSRTETVKKDETITVEGNRTETVKKDETITVEGAKKDEVKSTYDVKAKGAFTLEDDEEITFKTGDSSITLKKDGTIEIKGKTVKVEGEKAKASFDGSEAKIEGPKVDVKGDDGVKLDGAKVELK